MKFDGKLIFKIFFIVGVALIMLFIFIGKLHAQTPALTHEKQYTYGYDAVYAGDWRFVPTNMTATDSYVLDSITNKSFSRFVEITTGSASCYLNFKIPLNSPIVITTFTLDDSDGYTVSLTESINSTNGTDGDWTDIDFTLQNWQYHTNTAQYVTFEKSASDRWVKLQWTNSASGTLQIKDVGMFKLNTKPWLRNDIWLALGASIQNSAMNATLANLHAREEFGTDPLIINLGYSGKTISYLADSVHMMIENNPYAGYSFVHMGGNDVSNSRPYSGTDQAFKDDFIEDTRTVMRELDRNGIVNIYGRLSFRRYTTAPSVEDGVYEENGSLPYNTNLIDPTIEEFNQRAYHQGVKAKPILDFYGHTLLDSIGINVDGIHLTTDGKANWRNYVVDVLGDYIYNHVKADTLYYRTWIENCDYYIAIAESTTLNADIVIAQYYVTKLPDGAEKTAYQAEIDAIVCSDCSVTNVYVSIGSNTLAGWNSFSSRTPGSNVTALIDDGSGVTGIAIKTTSGWDADAAGYTANGYQTGDDSGHFPDAALLQAWYNRATPKDITFYNLDDTKTYTIEIMGSRVTVGKRLTSYDIGGTIIGVDAEDNYLNYATFSNISPDGSDEIIITIRDGALIDPDNEEYGYGYINAVKITWSN